MASENRLVDLFDEAIFAMAQKAAADACHRSRPMTEPLGANEDADALQQELRRITRLASIARGERDGDAG